MAKKIFLIEDEFPLQQLYTTILTKQGFQVDTAADGQAALNKLTQGQPDYDLILLDIMLPSVDGITILKTIKASDSPSKHIPVFLLTNLGETSLVNEGMSLGAAQYWIKAHINPVQLAQEIATFLNAPTPTT